MPLLATILSALVAGVGAIAVFWPDTVLEVARTYLTTNGLLVAAAFRIVFGGALLIAASGSRAPNLLRGFGILILIAGLATPIFGLVRARNLVEFFASGGGGMIRVAGTLAIALGCGFAWSLSPRVGGSLRS
jgi:hypothetical protein